MKNNLSKKTMGLAAAAITLIMCLNVGNALAYFTAYTAAEGGAAIELGQSITRPEEEFSDWTKTVVIENTGDYPCYVRVSAIAGSLYQNGLTYSDESGKWSPGRDGYYYYSDPIAPGEKTDMIKIRIPKPADDAKDFNVIVIQECVPVLYDENGEAYADWNLAAVSGLEQNSGEEVLE